MSHALVGAAYQGSTHDLALTLTTNQIKGWGVAGIVIIVVAVMLIVGLAKSTVGRTIWVVLGLILLFLLWQQHSEIESSIKACNPHVLFIHLQISDPHQLATCQQITNPKG